jgi:DNA/RNA endonuclease YhcR with UshA esterase domain
MRMRPFRLACIAALALGPVACDSPTDRELEINARGVIYGVLFIDKDGNDLLTPADVPMPTVRATLTRPGSPEVLAEGRTDASGRVRFFAVPVGRYQINVDAEALGDTLRMAKPDTTFTVTAYDSTFAFVRVRYRGSTLAEARALPLGRALTVDGVALNDRGTYGDSTVNIYDGTGTIRVVQLGEAAISAGDSVRVVGRIARRAGQPVIGGDPRAYVLGKAVASPAARALGTAAAANAMGGQADASLAAVTGALITDTSTVNGNFLVTVDDGSGALVVQMDRAANINPDPRVALGASLDATGVLVPEDGGTWRLKPRKTADVTVRFPAVRVAEARAMAVGNRAVINGIILNGWTTFGDSTVHIADSSGSIRIIRTPAFSFVTGDSVRVVGRLATLLGQPVLTEASGYFLAKGTSPTPAPVFAQQLSTADGGRLDAALARITGATIADTTLFHGDIRVRVTDASGSATVLLDFDARITPSPAITLGATLDATGVLVPDTTGTGWVLKPRVANDVTVRFPPIPISAARAATIGTRVIVNGLLTSRWGAFGDSTMHVVDGTGSIRVSSATPFTFVAGDSVRVIGLLVQRDGQPTISEAAVTRLGSGQLGVPPVLTTAQAASAQGGTRDAALVGVRGARLLNTQTLGSDILLSVNDGSGLLEVILHSSANVRPNPELLPGAVLDLTGVLVPAATGPARWQLKPRGTADVVATYPVVTIAAARDGQIGRALSVEGVALNAQGTFGDNTVHLVDATGAIRLVSVQSAFVEAGDSLRVMGTLQMSGGQIALNTRTLTVLGQGTIPPPVTLSTAVAATAANGTRDAALIRVVEATIAEIPERGGTESFRMFVDDGSGRLEVLILPTTGIPTTGLAVGRRVTLVGVLVGKGGGGWQLQPRVRSDVTVHP